MEIFIGYIGNYISDVVYVAMNGTILDYIYLIATYIVRIIEYVIG